MISLLEKIMGLVSCIMKDDIVVSVIVPIYNVENVLHKCVESICCQTYKNLEILLIDDGSTDKSAAVCDAYARKDGRITVHHLKNAGVAHARNYALDHFSGEYCVFVDSDDFVEATYVEKLLYAVQSAGLLLGTCHSVDYDYAENVPEYNVGKGIMQVISLEQYRYISSYVHVVCWAAIYHKSLVSGIRFRADLKVGEDTLFFANVLKKAGKVVDLSEFLYFHVHYTESLSQGAYDNKKYTEVLAWKNVCELFQDQNKEFYDSCKAALAIRCYRGIKRALISNVLEQDYYDDMLKTARQNWRHVFRPEILWKDKILYLWICAFPKMFGTCYRIWRHEK